MMLHAQIEPESTFTVKPMTSFWIVKFGTMWDKKNCKKWLANWTERQEHRGWKLNIGDTEGKKERQETCVGEGEKNTSGNR